MERIPPFNLEAERAVLGSCLLDSEALNTAVEMLAAEDFTTRATGRPSRS